MNDNFKKMLLENINRNFYLTINNKNIIEMNEVVKKTTTPIGIIPAINEIHLGSQRFCESYGLTFPYMAGAMANGIASEELVIALGKAGYLGSFGSGGLSLERIEKAVDRIQAELKNKPYCFNLLHNMKDPKAEMNVVKLYIGKGVRVIEAAAFNVNLSLPLVYYRLAGLHKDSTGKVTGTNRIIAKVSRQEIADKFMSPVPEAMAQELFQSGLINSEQMQLSRKIALADEVTVEADSAGHTDNRPLISVLPAMIELRNQLQLKLNLDQQILIGAAGGISTPQSMLGAFAMGADYVVTGSINQACLESGTSSHVRQLLLNAEMADVMMAPAADMFELGAKVQVLKKGTMFGLNAQKLYDYYKNYPSLDAIPSQEIDVLEKRILKRKVSEVWNDTVDYFNKVQPDALKKIDQEPRKKMALVFRWYLGKSSRWAIDNNPERIIDAQIWCGQSMGAFNLWAKSNRFHELENRKANEVANELILQTKILKRIDLLKTYI